jgi:hypothetical protein
MRKFRSEAADLGLNIEIGQDEFEKREHKAGPGDYCSFGRSLKTGERGWREGRRSSALGNKSLS